MSKRSLFRAGLKAAVEQQAAKRQGKFKFLKQISDFECIMLTSQTAKIR